MKITELPELAKVFNYDDSKIVSITKEVNLLEEKKRDLLPFEQAQIGSLMSSKLSTINTIKQNYSSLDGKFKRIDLDIITKMRIWNNHLHCYVPRFAIYNLDSRELKMSISEVFKGGDRNKEHYIKLEIESESRLMDVSAFKNYRDMSIMSGWDMLKYENESTKYFSTITHKFEGFLPDDIRNTIRDSVGMEHDKFKMSELYLIEESYNWKKEKKEEKEPIRNLDPVIVGIRNDVAYYICSFDVTPVEKFLVSELVA